MEADLYSLLSKKLLSTYVAFGGQILRSISQNYLLLEIP